ncbi:tyrosine-type recombinase/integrase, partial [Sutterella wadsworthensis]|uniref:tyrosine-type recombinase/integrase n=1 Tax=Sutterella wadsworthensis TaxID=40545 RepID=UPI003A8DA310
RCTTNEELQHFLKLMAVWHWWFPEALLPLMIMLTVVLATRVNECCDLSWTEINLNNNTIVLPKERKKFKKGDPFIIPLSKQALWIIKEALQKPPCQAGWNKNVLFGFS